MSETINLAKYRKGADNFEIVVNPDKAINYRRHPEMDIRDVLVYPKVYSDAKKGMLTTDQKLMSAFGTTDALEAAKQILLKGEVHATAEYRREQIEQKKRRITDLIHRQGVDPRTNATHPLTRIENAIAEAKIKIDENESAEAQVQRILKELRTILPIKLVTKELQISIPAQYAPKTFATIKNFGKIIKENWAQDGSWSGTVEIPGGLEDEFYEKLNKLTQGNMQATLLRTKGDIE